MPACLSSSVRPMKVCAPTRCPNTATLSEIEQELGKAAGQQVAISFTPHLVPVHNGICTTTSAQLTADPDQVQQALERAYG